MSTPFRFKTFTLKNVAFFGIPSTVFEEILEIIEESGIDLLKTALKLAARPKDIWNYITGGYGVAFVFENTDLTLTTTLVETKTDIFCNTNNWK